MTDNDEISRLAQAIAACRICREVSPQERRLPMPHEPRPVVVLSAKAKVLIAGQAPGMRVHQSGLPFDDASGNRLREWLAVSREEFYDPNRFAIVPMGFCFPGYDAKGSDLPPRRECAPLWRNQVLKAMPQIELVLAVGSYAQSWHLEDGRRGTMTATVENWRHSYFVNSGPRILPLPHPSWRNTGWLRKNPWFETDLLPVLRKHVDSLIRGTDFG